MGLFSFLGDLGEGFGSGLGKIGGFLGSPEGFGSMAGLGALSDLYSGYLNKQQMDRQQQIASRYQDPAYMANLVKQAYIPITDQQRAQLLRSQMAVQAQTGLTQGNYPAYLLDQVLAGDTLQRQQMAQNQALNEMAGASRSIPVPSQYGFTGGSLGSVVAPMMQMQMMSQLMRQQQPTQEPVQDTVSYTEGSPYGSPYGWAEEGFMPFGEEGIL